MYCSSWRGITHKWAARYLLPVLTIVILTQCHSAPAVLSSLLLVGAGWLTFAASARLHTTIWHKVECEQQAAKLDVGVISFLIAWGGAPTVIVLIGGAYGWLVFVGGTLLAFCTAGMTAFDRWPDSHVIRFDVAIFVLQGITTFVPVLLECLPSGRSTSLEAWCWSGATLFYIGGAAILAFKFPDPSHNHFGYHELWHAAIILAFSCQFHANLSVVVRNGQ